MSEQEWFASWFDSPYYPILYQHRDYSEAESFIRHLLSFLGPDKDSHFLDLACGRGRHSVFINRHGYKVTGLDLSPDSIADAKKNIAENLSFGVHDMRDPLPGQFTFILNMFTSFGYFDDQGDNLKVLHNVRKALLPDGRFVLDFMNVEQVIPRLVAEEEKELNGIHFGLRRSVKDGFIVKDIEVRDGDKSYAFQERVQALDRNAFSNLFAQAGLEVVHIWGDYHGGEFSAENSPRLIYFCR